MAVGAVAAAGRRAGATRSTVRRQRVPAQVRLRHARHRSAHAVEHQPRVRAQQGGEGRASSRAPCPRPRAPTRASMPPAGASGWTWATRRDRERSLEELAARPARQAQAAGRRRVRRARRSQQRRAQAGADPVLRRGLAQAHGDHQRVHGQAAADSRARWTWACRSRIRRTSCGSSSTAASPTSSASR